MRRTPWATYCWPGLPEVWAYGSWSALALAVSMGFLLNLALLGTFGWDEMFAPGFRKVLWGVVSAGWGLSALLAWVRGGHAETEHVPAPEADTFGEAQVHYLRGDWYRAERLLIGLLQRDVRDVDARMMLASVYRHTGRHQEARHQLDQLDRYEGSRKWELEIGRERDLLDEAESSPQQEETVQNTVCQGESGEPARLVDAA